MLFCTWYNGFSLSKAPSLLSPLDRRLFAALRYPLRVGREVSWT